jgi:peptidoglycan/xylan/chitin deacetylase (PgdA/CDA1 family)
MRKSASALAFHSSFSVFAIAVATTGAVAASAAAGCTQAPDPESPIATQADLLQGDVALDGADLPDHVLSLTFDDGPGPKTLALAEYLKNEKIQATFFVIGQVAEGKADVLRKLKAMGHLVANHTYTHTPIIQSQDPRTELLRTDALIAPFVTDNMFLFRAPQGKWNAQVATVLNQGGLGRYVGHIHWRAGGTFSAQTSMDWNCWGQGSSIPECGRGYLNEIGAAGRGVVLMHDVHERTYDLVRWAVPRLKARGFAFARLDADPAIAAGLRKSGGKPSAKLPLAAAPTPPRTTLSSTPFDLAFLAYRGELTEEGIPGAGSLCDALHGTAVTAPVLADAAAYSGRLTLPEARDGSYLNALELQLNAICN